jgi:hypothetical protein
MGVLNNVKMQQQKNSQWCWAAVTCCVFPTFQPGPVTQEDVVCKMLINEDCRLSPTPGICDVPFPLEMAIRKICKCVVRLKEVLSFAQIQNQIDTAQRPLPIGLTFTSPLGFVLHYCVIKGCAILSDGKQEVIVLDPAHADQSESRVSYAALCDGSAMGAQWTDSFVLQ